MGVNDEFFKIIEASKPLSDKERGVGYLGKALAQPIISAAYNSKVPHFYEAATIAFVRNCGTISWTNRSRRYAVIWWDGYRRKQVALSKWR